MPPLPYPYLICCFFMIFSFFIVSVLTFLSDYPFWNLLRIVHNSHVFHPFPRSLSYVNSSYDNNRFKSFLSHNYYTILPSPRIYQIFLFVFSYFVFLPFFELFSHRLFCLSLTLILPSSQIPSILDNTLPFPLYYVLSDSLAFPPTNLHYICMNKCFLPHVCNDLYFFL